jgi:methylenetetrahydrofolate dehydrogenase (NADP+)/methenyltetrahydrofolate cyclohydrolase
MTAKRLDGKVLARDVRRALKVRVREQLQDQGRVPCLAVVLVGEDSASQIYVASKERMAGRVGIRSLAHRLPASTSQVDLEDLLGRLGEDKSVDGILLQLPLPEGLDEAAALEKIPPSKDVDGLHPRNLANLALGQEGLLPCTPKGVIRLLQEASFQFTGARALVIGRSRLVGKPLAYLLTNRHATVTLAHSRTRNLAELARQADLVIAAVGRREMVRGDWIQKGAWVVDVGIHRGEDGTLAGDVAFAEVAPRASHITPVPGGVGPMTISMLLENTVLAWESRL